MPAPRTAAAAAVLLLALAACSGDRLPAAPDDARPRSALVAGQERIGFARIGSLPKAHAAASSFGPCTSQDYVRGEWRLVIEPWMRATLLAALRDGHPVVVEWETRHYLNFAGRRRVHETWQLSSTDGPLDAGEKDTTRVGPGNVEDIVGGASYLPPAVVWDHLATGEALTLSMQAVAQASVEERCGQKVPYGAQAMWRIVREPGLVIDYNILM